MKNKKLEFKKGTIVELSDDSLSTINGVSILPPRDTTWFCSMETCNDTQTETNPPVSIVDRPTHPLCNQVLSAM